MCALTATPAGEGGGLYEWSAGRLSLVSVLPANEAKQPGEAAKGTVNLGYGDIAARHAVSDDGSRVIWEAQPNGKHHLYMTDMADGEVGASRCSPAGRVGPWKSATAVSDRCG